MVVTFDCCCCFSSELCFVDVVVVVVLALSGGDIEARHCAVKSGEDKVTLVLADGKCYVNHMEVVQDFGLSHGQSVLANIHI